MSPKSCLNSQIFLLPALQETDLAKTFVNINNWNWANIPIWSLSGHCNQFLILEQLKN